MHGYEGIGSIYWHMVAKLLLAVQERTIEVEADGRDEAVLERLTAAYRRVRDGLGFRKDPATYGAFPTDCYSHTPAHAGAQQPGMTGQVKEEVLTRAGELGLRSPTAGWPGDGRCCPTTELWVDLDGRVASTLTVCGTPVRVEAAEPTRSGSSVRAATSRWSRVVRSTARRPRRCSTAPARSSGRGPARGPSVLPGRRDRG
jgi:hypothetical protein